MAVFVLTWLALHLPGANPTPFVLGPKVYDHLPTGTTKPTGWLRLQLEAQRDGECSHRVLGK